MPIKGLLLDLDGTLYVGEEPVPGAREAVQRLKAAGLALRYVTNTTRMPRRAVVEGLRALGFEATEDKVFTPARAAARLMRNKRCLALVDGSLLEDLKGITLTEESPDFVLVGDLGEGFTYARLDAAFKCLMNGARLVALQKNRYWRTPGGLSLDAGPFVAALEYATGQQAAVVGKPEEAFFRIALEDLRLEAGEVATGEQAAVVGKPEEAFFRIALEDLRLEAGEVAMVGDDAEADVAGAKRAGLLGIQVRTGKWGSDAEERQADLVLDSVAGLPTELGV